MAARQTNPRVGYGMTTRDRDDAVAQAARARAAGYQGVKIIHHRDGLYEVSVKEKALSNGWFDWGRKTTVHRVGGRYAGSSTSTSSFKGHRIYKTASGYSVPDIDRESVFDDKTQAKRFITSWSKNNRGRKMARKRTNTSPKRRRFKKRLKRLQDADVKMKMNPVKMRKAPRAWMKAKAVRVVRRGGRQVVEVRR